MKKYYKVMAFFIIICFLPFLRSCGDISAGFPVVVSAGNSILNFKHFRLAGLLINLIVLGTLCFIAIYMLEKKKISRYSMAGIKAVIFYHAIILSGYLIVHPLLQFFHNVVLEWIGGIHLFIIYPVVQLVNISSLEDISRNSALYGDIYDIKFRLIYLMMVLLWFFAGYAVSRYRTPHPASALPMPPSSPPPPPYGGPPSP